MDDRELKRAGLDYHEYATRRASIAISPPAARRSIAQRPRRWFAFTTDGRGARSTTRASRRATCWCSAARPRACRTPCSRSFAADARLRIPMRPGVRSLNLSNAVAVAVYEAWRQTGFAGAG